MPSALWTRVALGLAALVSGSRLAHAQPAPLPRDSALALINAAAAHLGGLDALARVQRLRLEYITHWYRPAFAPTPSGLPHAGSLEYNTDTRDYSRPAWRQFRGGTPAAAQAVGITNVVVDSVAVALTPRGALLLNATYLAERDELFLQAPERLLPVLDSIGRHGGRLSIQDTVVAGVALTGVSADLHGRRATLWLDPGGFVAGVRLRAAQPLDIGLAAYRVMDVDAWFAQWRAAGGVMFPGHVRILRVGEAYKELFVQAITVNPPVSADSFLVSDSLRTAFAAAGARAMFDVPIPPLRADSAGVVTFGPPQVMQGAVRLRAGWLFIGAGADSLVMRRAVEATGARRGAVVIPAATPSAAGGAPAADRFGLDVMVPYGALGVVQAIYRQQGLAPGRLHPMAEGTWTTVGGDSVWVEPLSVPDVPGAALVWVPSLAWAYLAVGPGAMQVRAALALLDRRGFRPARIGTVRAMSRPAGDVRREVGASPRP